MAQEAVDTEQSGYQKYRHPCKKIVKVIYAAVDQQEENDRNEYARGVEKTQTLSGKSNYTESVRRLTNTYIRYYKDNNGVTITLI
jgi:hypothetical protein